MNILERVARAVCAAHGINPNKPDDKPAWQRFNPEAAAAIDAMNQSAQKAVNSPRSGDNRDV